MFTRLFNDLNLFLNDYNISAIHSRIFEEELLKYAGVSMHNPVISVDPAGDTRMTISIQDMQEADAKKFLALFLEYGEDSSAVMHAGNDRSCVFEMDAYAVYHRLLPRFKYDLLKRAEVAPETLKKYQDESAGSFDVRSKKSRDELCALLDKLDGLIADNSDSIRERNMAVALSMTSRCLRAHILFLSPLDALTATSRNLLEYCKETPLINAKYDLARLESKLDAFINLVRPHVWKKSGMNSNNYFTIASTYSIFDTVKKSKTEKALAVNITHQESGHKGSYSI